MRTGPVLATDLVDKYQPLGAFGQPVYLSYVQLRATIAQKLGARHANYFARPDRDPQNKSIHWIAEVAGTARALVRPLGRRSRPATPLDLQAMRSDFIRYMTNCAGKVRACRGSREAERRRQRGRRLRQPAGSRRCWCRTTATSTSSAISRWSRSGASAPSSGQGSIRWPMAPARPRPPPAGTRGARGGCRGQAAVALPFERPRRPWWRWLLWALACCCSCCCCCSALYRCLPDERAATVPFGTAPNEQPLAERSRDDSILGRTLRFLGLEEAVTGRRT